MSVNDLTNLGIEADMPDELQRISADAEYATLLQQFGIVNPAMLNADVWADDAERRRLAGIIAHNLAGRIATTRHALSQAQLTDLLTPRIQAASEVVARRELGTPEIQQAVATILAQAMYDALPKEIWHVTVEQEIDRRYGATPDRDAARTFYRNLRESNDANDMIAGMAMFMAMNDPSASPSGTVAILGGPPAVPSWQTKYGTTNTDTLNRKSVAETLVQMKAMQPIALPNKVPPASTRAGIDVIRQTITAVPGGGVDLLNNEIGQWDAMELAYNAAKATHEPQLAAWEHVEKEWSDHRLATQAALAAGHAAPAPPAAPRTPRPTIGAPQPVFNQVVLPGVFRETIRTADKAREKIAELEALDQTLQAAQGEMDRRRRMLDTFVAVLRGMRIQNIDALFPTLAAASTGRTLAAGSTIDPAVFTANFDFAALATEIERNFPNGLKSVDDYSKEVVEAGKQKVNGLDLTKSVFRSFVSTRQPSLSNADVESVANYMINRAKVDNILRTSVEQAMDNYLDVGDRTLGDNVSNMWYGNERGRPARTIDEIAAALRVPRQAGGYPNWQAATYEQVSAAYYAIKELVDGKGPADLRMTGKPQAAIDNLRILSRILTTKYAGQMEAKLVASLPEDQRKSVTQSRARLAQAVQSALTGDTPDWTRADVARAHTRADQRVAWFSRGMYNVPTGIGKSIGTNVGSWVGKAWGNKPAWGTVKGVGTEAAKIAAWSFLGGPAIGIAAYMAMRHFSPPAKSA